MKRTMLLGFALASTAAAAEPQTMPAWLTGCHVETKGESWTEECWTIPRAGNMLGSGRSGKGDKLLNWESMRIERTADGSLIFWGSPRGATAVPFKATSVSASEVVFANPAHDYPQRIRYWREGTAVHAETALKDGSKAMRWVYAPMGQ